MNLYDFTVYKTIYELRSLNQAAKALGYAQSNLTARLKEIEETFQTTLFTRSYQGLMPTENGDKLYQFTIQTLQQIDHLKATFQKDKPQVLISELLFHYLILEKEQLAFGDYTFTIKKSRALKQALAEQTYEHFFTYQPVKYSQYQLKEKASIPAYFFTSATKKVESPIVLINSDPTCPFRQKTLELLSNQPAIAEVDSLENILQLIAAGKGIALLPATLKTKQEYQFFYATEYAIDYYHYQLI